MDELMKSEALGKAYNQYKSVHAIRGRLLDLFLIVSVNCQVFRFRINSKR